MKSTVVRCLASCVALAGAWLVYRWTVVPMQEREREVHTELAALESQIAARGIR